MPYAEYAFYTDTYGGDTVPQTLWNRIAVRADAYVDRMTFARLHAPSTVIPDSVRMAACAVADEIYAQTQADAQHTSGVASENTDGYQVNFESAMDTIVRHDRAMLDALDTYLPRSHPLRYAGV